MDVFTKAKFNKDGLITCIAQDAATGKVLMCAHMNQEALELTLKTGNMTYWSRSRGKLWVKGETSGNTQKLVEAHFDCDGDALLCKVIQNGPACHEGNLSCFSYKIDKNTNQIIFDGEPHGKNSCND